MPKFIHFGCWNKGGCFLNDDTEQTNGLTNVMKLLKDTVNSSSEPYQFISIAGDNYYPTKLKSSRIKIFDEEELISGFNCLPKNLPIDVIMGNHDYEQKLNAYDKINDEIIDISDCKILDTEYKLNEITPNINVKVFDFKPLDDKTKILMIDTTMYDDKYIEQNIDCYFKHPELEVLIGQGDDLTSKIRNIRESQNEHIIKNISSINNGNNLIIIGHHPITGFKYKKGNLDLIDSPGKPFFNMLYNTIHLNLKDKNVNYYYLCADLHQYQIGNISIGMNGTDPINNMFIKQYIVGTGGADLDPYELPLIREKQERLNNLEIENFALNYLITQEEVTLSEESYGYGILECESNDSGELKFKFIKTSKEEKIESMPQNKSIEQLKRLVSSQSSTSSSSIPSSGISSPSLQDTVLSFKKGGRGKTYKKHYFKNKKTNKNKGKRRIKLSKSKKNKYTKKKRKLRTKKNKK